MMEFKDEEMKEEYMQLENDRLSIANTEATAFQKESLNNPETLKE